MKQDNEHIISLELNTLTAISPIDGRYRDKTKELALYFSEYALIKYRVQTEVENFIKLAKTLPQFSTLDDDRELAVALRKVVTSFSLEDATWVKEEEKKINHDVKAVENFVRKKVTDLGYGEYKEFVHFGLTSQDISNTAIPGMMRAFLEDIYYELLGEVKGTLVNLERSSYVPMLARTHGQPATPTQMGKELHVFNYRLTEQVNVLKHIPHKAKFGGAAGNFNAHVVAYPDIDWPSFADSLLEDIHLEREEFTTQISNYDTLARQLDAFKRINTILFDLCRDIWDYVSRGYFKQIIKKEEVGSSTMPHKVNPIDFENAEGNIGIANAMFEHLSAKLPVSRLQRDLTDSTATRYIGFGMACTLIAFKSIIKGLGKLRINEEKIREDLENNWAVITEALQTILRREGFVEPYEELKKLARIEGPVTKESIHAFIDKLDVSEELKDELKAVTPWNYTGIL